MTLPTISTVVVSTKATQHYLNRIAAAQAGGTPVNFTQGEVIVGDGNGEIPLISALLAAGGVIHEVGRGSWVQGVTVNPTDAAQVDILCVVPAVDGSGEEIGPFWVTEYAITDENGDVCLVGTTAMAKFVSANGGLSDLAWIAAEKVSNGNVILTPPSAAFATILDVILMINAHHPRVQLPLERVDTMLSNGWLDVLYRIRAATSALTGYGRQATDAEFAAGQAAAGPGVFQFPWPSIQQVKNAILTYASGVGVRVAENRTVNLDYEPLATTTPALTDIVALLRPAVGQTPASYKKFTLASLRDLFTPDLSRAFSAYKTPGNFNYATPTWSRAIFYIAWAGGGAGGRGNNGGAGSGGGGAECRFGVLVAGVDYDPGDVLPVAIGAGGQPSPNNGGDGAPGGSTSIGSLVLAIGGDGGIGSATATYAPAVDGGTGGLGGFGVPGGKSGKGAPWQAGAGGASFCMPPSLTHFISSQTEGSPGEFYGGGGSASGATFGLFPQAGAGKHGAALLLAIG
ncbi:phage tail protein [Methylocystis sp. WRRC1]|uniref:phage tail-collar fiber domain-containing protein n=1 Tax=unclassified Methylocystis TaxID=2625913 RepID=UPI0001F86A98|nr:MULTISPECIES: phage tail protein [unclassified Methylocystis]MCC3246135.1 phage tail protein [Methylocystis sp. WRRC1]